MRLAGKIRGNFIVSPSASVADEERFYRGVEWAIDVRDVEFTVGTGLLGVPPALVRCTPGHDWLVTRRSAERAGFNAIMEAPGHWAAVVSALLISGRESMIVFGPRGKTAPAKRAAQGIARCVDMGVMLPIP